MQLRRQEAIAIAVPYFIAIGACYLFGYWGAFNVNVLEFIDLADLAKLAIYPLIGSVLAWLAGMVIAELFMAPTFPPGGGAGTPVGVFLVKHRHLMMKINLVAIVAVCFFASEPTKW